MPTATNEFGDAVLDAPATNEWGDAVAAPTPVEPTVLPRSPEGWSPVGEETVLTPKQQASTDEIANRLRLKEQIERVESPVSTGLRESALEGVHAVTSPQGLAWGAGLVAAPEVAGPLLFGVTASQVKPTLQEIQRARESGDRAAYYKGIGNLAQLAYVLKGTGRSVTDLRPPLASDLPPIIEQPTVLRPPFRPTPVAPTGPTRLPGRPVPPEAPAPAAAPAPKPAPATETPTLTVPDYDPQGIGARERIKRRQEAGQTRDEAIAGDAADVQSTRDWAEKNTREGDVIETPIGRRYRRDEFGDWYDVFDGKQRGTRIGDPSGLRGGKIVQRGTKVRGSDDAVIVGEESPAPAEAPKPAPPATIEAFNKALGPLVRASMNQKPGDYAPWRALQQWFKDTYGVSDAEAVRYAKEAELAPESSPANAGLFYGLQSRTAPKPAPLTPAEQAAASAPVTTPLTPEELAVIDAKIARGEGLSNEEVTRLKKEASAGLGTAPTTESTAAPPVEPPKPAVERRWKNLGEGPWDTYEDALQFAENEVGVDYRITQRKNGDWIIETPVVPRGQRKVGQQVATVTPTTPEQLPVSKVTGAVGLSKDLSGGVRVKWTGASGKEYHGVTIGKPKPIKIGGVDTFEVMVEEVGGEQLVDPFGNIDPHARNISHLDIRQLSRDEKNITPKGAPTERQLESPKPAAAPAPAPEPAPGAAEALPPIQRKSPTLGTPEREAIESAFNAADAKRTEAYEKIIKAQGERDKMGRYTNARERKEKQLERLEEAYRKVKADTEEVIQQGIQAHREDRAGDVNPLAAIDAREQLKLISSNDAYNLKKRLLVEEGRRQGLSPAEAESVAIEAITFTAFKPDEPLSKIVEYRTGRTRFETVKREAQREMETVLEESRAAGGYAHRGVSDSRIRQAMSNAHDKAGVDKALAEAKELARERNAETARTTKARADADKERQQRELELARKLQSEGKLFWIWTAQKRWVPVDAKPVKIEGFPWLKAFIRKVEGEWVVSEETSGSSIGSAPIRADAIKSAAQRAATAGDQRLRELIANASKTLPGKPSLTEPPAPPPAPGAEPSEQARTTPATDPFDRARRGDDTAFDDLDAQFREIYPEPEEQAHRGRPDPNQVYTAKQFADRFNTAFAARDFQTVLDTIKATSNVSIWKPFLKDLFATQAKDPIAAKKAEWFRHVFNGTVPPDAIPRAPRPAPAQPQPQPTPKPQPGAQPGAQPSGGPGAGPSTPPPQPPAPPPPRIEVEPIVGGKAKSPYQIIEDFSAAIKKSIRVLRLKRNTLGTYTPGSTRTAERFAGDLDTAAHELAGHWTDDRYGIGKPWIAPRVRSPYDAELAKFWIHGSVTPTSTLRYRRAEGIAEFIRAYVVNPVKAKAEAPNFAAYFERTLPTDALKAINDFGIDVRTWAGEDPLIRAGLNIRMEPPSLTERLWKGIRGRGFGFEINPIDKLRLWFDDPYHYAVKAFHEMRSVRGGTLLPKDNFELQARLLATHDARMSDQFENGLTPLRPTQSRSPTGELVVDRIVDPVTREPMSMKWMLDPLDKASKAKMNQDMRDASAYMVAQRTLEKGAQTGRESQISGIGAGIMTDKKAALELLNRVAQDPPREARLKEAARRYRLWADSNIDMLVDSGRLSPEQAREIRKNNQQYVDMHRLSQEFEMGFRGQHGRNIGTARNVIKRFKGSTLELDNVYSNLLEQTDAIQKEAFRNVTMNTFTDQLRNVRALHGPDLKDFDQFGTRVTSEDKNTIRVFKDGKGEYWKFDPDIYESLKGLGELGTHPFIDLASKPSQFVRYMITHGPQFILRNTVRDTFERSVVSRSGSRPWDILQGYTPAELSRYEVFGGGQFGNYIVDRHVWNRELKKAVAEMSKDPKNIFLSPLKLKTAWERLSENSEKLGRIAEFRRAFEHGQKQLGYDDYNAALYAAGEARGLLDFAKAGTVMRSINRLVPFSNARIRGLARATSSMAENPGRFAMRWGMFVLVPTLANLLWNRKDKETWDEYQQLPAYQKDFFWNFKVGDYWLRVPKPHELGVMAGGVTRAIDRMLGDKRAMEGWWGSAANAVTPLNTPVESTGPLRSFLELYFNKDSFQGREIVPAWEKDLKLELRKGVTHASGAGQAIAKAINVTGLGVDPRQVDYVLQNFGGLGQIATDLTRRSPGEAALRATGYIAQSPGASARDVQWVFSWARENGKMNAAYIRDLTALRKLALDAKTVEERNALNKRLREASTYLRNALEPTK